MKTAGRKTASIYHPYNIVNESDLRKAMEKQGTYLIEVAAKETKPSSYDHGAVKNADPKKTRIVRA